MLAQSKAFSNFSVNNVAKAKHFYENILGLKVSENEMSILILHLTHGMEVIVYPKGDAHVPASFTVLKFPITNIELVVKKLLEKGIELEHYKNHETDTKGIHRNSKNGNEPDIAWFKDPAGNICSIIESK